MGALQRARSLLQSDFGRKDGWYVELAGVVVGVLDDPKRVELFWHSYAVRSTPPDGAALGDDDAWNRCAFAFRNRRTGELVRSAFCGGNPPFVRDGRVVMRGLYLVPASVLERACLHLLKRMRSPDYSGS